MKATELVTFLQEGKGEEMFSMLYIDKGLLGLQAKRYIQAIHTFIELYGDKEIEIYSTPGRSEISGNHTDHQHGKVLAAAINLDMIAIVSSCEDVVEIVSDKQRLKTIAIDDLEKKDSEAGTSESLVRGVLAGFKKVGYRIGGFQGYFTSDVLQGSGLSSSAAFEVMIGTILSGLYEGGNVSPVEIAKIGQYSENEYFEKPCGLMDQCACSVGSLISIDFKDEPIVERLDVDFNQYHHNLCIIDVHASHMDLTEDYASIPAEMKEVAHCFDKEYLGEVEEEEFYQHLPDIRETLKNDRAILRAIHLFDENKRVDKAVESLKEDDFDAFKRTIQASGKSSFEYLQNIYSDANYQSQAVSLALALSERILQDKGVCRVHGGGFAGTIQAFVSEDIADDYKQQIEAYFGKDSCHVLAIRPVGGCKVF